MGLEASDLSDGAILESTQQFQNGNGQVQFKITLPSGRDLESEWLSPDMKKKAMVSWLDVVKDQAILDADQARAEAREAAMKERNAELTQAAPTQESGSTDLTTSTSTTHGQVQTSTTKPTSVTAPAFSQAAPVQTSPDDYVAAGLKAAEADYDHWNQVALDAVGRVQQAAKNIEKWTNIKRSLEGHEQSNSGDSRSDSRNNGSDIGPKRKRRQRRGGPILAGNASV